MPNRLANETSPYLLQHRDNPVDWYPWGEDALRRARADDKPILLSIGYAACHWCHVMAHESFEDRETAELMNERFVNVKVDREERPDLDGIYMSAVQAMTGHGGWPMTVVLTPDGVPFFGGTYFPPEDRRGMPSFRRVLHAVSDAWRTRRDEVTRSAEQIRGIYQHADVAARSSGPLSPALLERAYREIAKRYDVRYGGFEGAPKFPQAMAMDFLLRYWRRRGTRDALEMARASFIRMARGGIYDQIGGGFHRYAVDAQWLVPHFEKMLYDNALLIRLGAHLWQATGDAEIRRVVDESLAWIAREMTDPGGGFYSSLDADSEGEEGKFYVWEHGALAKLAGKDAPAVMAYWGVTPEGNFEGRTILSVPNDPAVVSARTGVGQATLAEAVARVRRVLADAREERVRPGRDDKVLAAWNGLMVRAAAEAARATASQEHRAMALRGGDFLFRDMVRDGRVLRSWKDGTVKGPGFLEDTAAVGLAAIALHELTFDRVWLDRARSLAESAVRWFWDDGAGAFFDTPSDHERLITRPREATDNATPSGTSLAAELLLRMAELTQDVDMRRRAEWVLETLAEPMARYGPAFGHLLGVADMAVHGALEVALVGDPARQDFRALERELAAHYLPSLVLAGGRADAAGGIALLADRPEREGRATAYVCRSYVCDEPVVEPGRLAGVLERATEVIGNQPSVVSRQ